MATNVTIDTTEVDKRLKELQNRVTSVDPKGLMVCGFELLRLSTFEVPHDTGRLQSSGNVKEVGKEVHVGYHTVYAARMHEHPEYHFQKGRKAKYLEDPLKNNLREFERFYGSTIKVGVFL